MGGALIQLVAYGMEDLYLTRDPQITFFKMVYRRYTPFTCEPIVQNFVHNPTFGSTSNCTISRNGDLVGNIFIVVKLPKVNLPQTKKIQFAWVKKIGFAMIKSVSIIINGYEIDRHYGDWLNVWAELSGEINDAQEKGYKQMIGQNPELYNFSYSKSEYKLYIPLQFWFCRTSGSALPLVSLTYSDVKINVEFQPAEYCYILSPTHYISCYENIVSFKEYEYIEQKISENDVRAGIFMYYDKNLQRLYYYSITNQKLIGFPSQLNTNTDILQSSEAQKYKIYGKTTKYSCYAIINATSPLTVIPKLTLNFSECFLLVDYYYLDEQERLRFTQNNHAYIVEQLFYTPSTQINDINRNIIINADNPSKMMIWTVQMKYIYDSKDYFNYSDTYQNKIFINEPYDVPLYSPIGNNIVKKSNILCNGNERITFRKSNYFEFVQQYQNTKITPQIGINTYSYALYPYEPIQPSGTFNTSQINNIEIKVNLKSIVSPNNIALFRAYSLSTNIFIVSNGLGALKFTI